MITRRRFIAGLATLPLVVKGFVKPSQATVAQSQKIYLTTVAPHLIEPSPFPIRTAPVFDGLTSGSFTFMKKTFPFNVSAESMAKTLSDKHCKVTATNDHSLIIEFIGGC